MKFIPGDTLCLPPRGISIAEPAPTQVGPPLRAKRRKTLAQYLLGSGLNAQQTINLMVHNPHTRLRWVISAGWELTNGVDFSAGAASPTWSIRNVRRDPEAGVQALLNQIFSSRALPDGYELDSGTKDVRVTIVLNPTDLATGLTGNFVVQCEWEANGVIDDELRRVINEVDLQAPNPIQIQNTS